jgi:arylsulfatase A-like enzyme
MPLNRVQQMTRFGSICVACFCAAVLSVEPANAIQESASPNFVILFSDDAGFADFGFQPNVRPEMKDLTPHIDTIARDGVRLSNAYVCGAVCSPSRAGMLTGRYQQRFGHETNIPPGYMKGGLSLDETFFVDRLRPLGYKTGLVGKWHLGYPDDYQPNRRGFDWFYGLLQGSRSYFPMAKSNPHRAFLENTTPTEEGGYTTDRIGDGAVRFIQENRAQPFFLLVSFTSPHGPLEPKEEDFAALSSIQNPKRRKYAGLVKSLDDNVGKILKALDDAGVAENTLVIFTNDNGGQTLTGANNAPLRGKKGDLFEGGIRVPMAIRWPGKSAPGSVIDDPVITLDFATTMIGLAGGKADPEWKLDGADLTDRLTQKTEALPERDLFWRTHGSSGPIAMRSGKWKLVMNRGKENPKPQLFDLDADIGEATDISAQNPELLKAMLSRLSVWETQLIEPLWGMNADEKTD